MGGPHPARLGGADGGDAPPLGGLVALDAGAVARVVVTLRGEGLTRARRLFVLARFAAFFARHGLARPAQGVRPARS